MHVFAKILMKGKYRLKIKHFLLKIGFNQVFGRQLRGSDFRSRITSVTLLEFGVKMLSQKNAFLVIKN